MEGSMCKTLVGIRSKYPAITQPYIIYLITRASTVHVMPLFGPLPGLKRKKKKEQKIKNQFIEV